MSDSPKGDVRRTMDSSLSSDNENRDSRCTGKKNENQYEKDILGDLGASPINSMASGLSPCHVLPTGVTSNSTLSQIPHVESSRDSRLSSGNVDKDGVVDLISVVPSSADGMNEYLMQHMRSLLNPLLVGGEDHTRSTHFPLKRGHANDENDTETRGIGPPSSGGSSSDDENDVLVWRLPPSALEARLLHEAAPASHDVSGDFIDIDMVTPSNQSMDGTSSMDEDPFVVMQNNLDGDDEDENASDDDRNLERVEDEHACGDVGVGRSVYAGGHLDPFIRRVEGHSGRCDDLDDHLESAESSSNEMIGVEGAEDSQPFNNLSLNLMAEERSNVTPVKSDSVPSDSCGHRHTDISSSRMNVTSSEEFSSPLPNSSCSSNPPPTPGLTAGSTKTMEDVDSNHLCDCSMFLWSEVINPASSNPSITPYIGPDEKVMLWTPQEVEEKRYFGLGDSSLSGPTALANVISVFNLHHRVPISAIRAAAPCTPGPAAMVDEGVPLTHFLLNRCAAGCPASSLVSAVHQLTDGVIRGFFLPMRAAVAPGCGTAGNCNGPLPLCGRWSCLWRWIAWLVRAGVVPMVTLNCQQQGLTPIDWIVPPDWHHQMVYGVDAGGLYLTGPEEFLQGDMAMTQLVSENILLVRKSQILALWKEEADLWELTRQTDPKWESMNVLGQVVGTLRQSGHKNFRGFQPEWAHHVAMPTPTHAGITLFVRTDPPTETTNFICQRLQTLSDRLHARLHSL